MNNTNIKIICIRHGEATGNVAFYQSFEKNNHILFTKKFCKIHSSKWKLTSNGINQSKEVGKKIKKIKINTFYTSDYVRTKQTAKLLGVSKIIHCSKLLRERNRGITECLSKPKYLSIMKLYKTSLIENSINWKPPKGESARDILIRIKLFFKKIKKKENTTVLIVTHEDFIQCLRFALRNKKISDNNYKKWLKHRGKIKFGQILSLNIINGKLFEEKI